MTRMILYLTLVNKTSHKFTGKLGQKVYKTKFRHNYKIILTLFLECNLKLASTPEFHVECNTLYYSETATHCGVTSLLPPGCYIHGECNKISLSAVTLYVCYIQLKNLKMGATSSFFGILQH